MATDINDVKPIDLAARAALVRLFNDTRKRLVETGTKNRLVHVNRANARGNVVNMVNERSDDVYAILSKKKTMRFLGIARDREDDKTGVPLADVGQEGFDTDRATDEQLETRMGPDALQKRLLKIAREAQTAEEDSGVNILYLALGFLTWFEDKSSAVGREAPLVLLPVELVRNQRTSIYDIRSRDEDVITNLPLQQRLKDDFGIQLPEIEIDEGWAPSSYFKQIDELIVSQKNWKLDRNGIQLGFFSFSKLLMYRDLSIEMWPEGAIADHALTRGLLYEGFESESPLFHDSERLDDALPPAKMFHVVDADASQARVIEEVRAGRNLVVQGPPGTGKSQTITNIIAAAVKEGKRVLFVAEKMAALSVVHDRLVKVGLRDICLELHSRTANKTALLAELARTLNAASAIPSLPAPPLALTKSRDKLNAFSELLHSQIGNTGATPFAVLSLQMRFIGKGAPPPSIESLSLATMTQEQERHAVGVLSRYGELLAEEGCVEQHPFAGTQNLDLQPVDLARLATLLTTANQAAIRLEKAVQTSVAALHLMVPNAMQSASFISEVLTSLDGLPAGTVEIARSILLVSDIPRLRQALEVGDAWRTARIAAEQTYVESAFTTPPDALRGPLVGGIDSFLCRWGSAYRAASRELAGLLRFAIPKMANERVELVDRLSHIFSSRARWGGDEEFCAAAIGSAWRGEQTDFARALAALTWCEKVSVAARRIPHEPLLALAQNHELLANMRRELNESEPVARRVIADAVDILRLDEQLLGSAEIGSADLGNIARRFDAMARSTGRYAGWARLALHHSRLVNAGLTELALRMQSGQLNGQSAVVELRYARAERLWQVARESSSLLRDLAHEKRHELVITFAQLERERLAENVTTIRAEHLGQVPMGAMGEMKVIRGEIGKKRGHIALRKLFASAGTAVQRIKPVLLMSPISVAQFIPPGALSFDLLVIDEASQVRPEDALGAIARAKQIVVVGDQKQLPPSSFFDRILADETDEHDGEEGEADLLDSAAKVGLMESILSLCEARGLSSRMLQWHYRSRDPSLIMVSNHEFYENKLILPPSPLQDDPAYGLCFTRVNGVYDKGGKRDNRGEGAAIVARVAEHARLHPDQSLGIVTFSTAQRSLVTELLEFSRRTDSILDEFLREGQAEDVFVKNIENVQGDERDVILISVCYGPVIPGGRLASMTFGPVNQEGGERRLNVLFSRARVRCEVFASFDPGDIDPGRVSRDGARILKRFLEFARDGRMLDAVPTGEAAESPFEEDVADVIRSLGYLVDPQVGSAGFRIDMGIRHSESPGTYVLAIECDGATYHSALWARERDRLRQDVLEHLGWRFHRIWSTDWFYNRQAEIERLRAALQEARTISTAGVRINGANRARPVSVDHVAAKPAVFEIPAVVVKKMPAYQRANFPVVGQQEPHEVGGAALAALVRRIVEAEGPIHVEEAARRLAACFGKEKAGSRIVALTDSALAEAKRNDVDLLSDGAFWFTVAQSKVPPVRDRSEESGATLKAKSISALEIGEALRLAREENAGGAEGQLIRVAARLLGFRRVGADLQERLTAKIGTDEHEWHRTGIELTPVKAFEIDGPGKYAVEVAGAIANQDAIAGIFDPRVSGLNSQLVTQLVLGSDGKVSVKVDGTDIGYLSKYIAREFRAAVVSGNLTEYDVFNCSARVSNRDGRQTIWVDLPEDI
ncbi:DUF3320 domain-containing protein [Massilia antarctica]|uniref:DUF3320 domain-containing protein n=1 Tax=Massilia antarctica TaxID=2765360 RepID=A0AA48WHB6_9BURK|nr:DUF3320 domain-containing protein [Massilia antarctica]QPI52710.1 DUF3320 domain-containing protein [Massilia antarctica]